MTAITKSAKQICMGCGKKFAATTLALHQNECRRYRLECSLIKAQDKIKT